MPDLCMVLKFKERLKRRFRSYHLIVPRLLKIGYSVLFKTSIHTNQSLWSMQTIPCMPAYNNERMTYHTQINAKLNLYSVQILDQLKFVISFEHIPSLLPIEST